MGGNQVMAHLDQHRRQAARVAMHRHGVIIAVDAIGLIVAQRQAGFGHCAQQALRKLIPQPAVDGPTLVKGFPAAALAKIVAPTLVVHGREDRVVPPECGLLIANSIPDADLQTLAQWVLDGPRP